MKHEDYKEMLAANALSALDEPDARALANHLEACGHCRAELHDWQETVAFMALNVEPSEPSLKVRERILAAARAEIPHSSMVQPNVGSGLSRVLPFEPRRRNVWTSLGSFGAIAAAVTLASMLAGLVFLWQQNRANHNEVIRLAAEMRDINQQLANERAMVALLITPGSRMKELSGTNAAPGAHAMIAFDKTGHAMLMTKNLPAPPPGKAYQLWFIKDNQKMPGKVFTPDDRGNVVMEDQIPASAMESAVYAITLEPESGVQIPTGAIYLVSAS